MNRESKAGLRIIESLNDLGIESLEPFKALSPNASMLLI
jgi:hypothetical protein